MRRDLDQLASQTFDVLVVGGGIYGLTIACDAAMRGLSVALVDRADFGSGATFNHLRTIHGGLRYLQSLDLGRARESVRERRTLARIAPHAVRSLPFALPLYRSLSRGKVAVGAGLLLDRIIATDRNRGILPSHHLPVGRVVSLDEAVRRFPGLRRRGLTGAAVWYDYTTVEADRLTFSWALAAHAHGALMANYVDATAVIERDGRVEGARVVDVPTGRRLDIRARLTVETTGGRFGRPGAPEPFLLRAMNLVTRRDAGSEAIGGASSSGRNLFLVPCRGRAIFGTWESPDGCSPAEAAPKESEVEGFIAELNHAFPSLDLRREEITLVHWGAVPAMPGRNGRMAPAGRERISDAGEGLISVAGTKYTTARAVAERVTDRVLEKLARPPVPCRTASTPLPGGTVGDVSATVARARRELDALLPSDAIPHLVAAYGAQYADVGALAVDNPQWRARVAPDSPVIGAELAWAARHEMVVTLGDAVVRRTPLGAMGYPGDDAAERAAAIVGGELGWTEERKRGEIEALRQFYRI